MNRHALLAALVALSGVTTFLSAVPSGIRDARGCSGASPQTCTSPGWTQAEWAVDPAGVPTNAGVKVRLTASYTCAGSGAGGSAGSGGSPNVTFAVEDASGAVVAGKPGAPDGPATKKPTTPITTDSVVVTWRPDAPLQPSTSYVLTVGGLPGGPKKLSFATGAAGFAPPKPVLLQPSVGIDQDHTTGAKICCLRPPGPPTYCSSTTTCADETREPAPTFSAKADVDEAVPAAKTFFESSVQISLDDGPYMTAPVDVSGAKKTICARVHAVNTLTAESADSEPWCSSLEGMDRTATPNCDAMLAVLKSCGATPGAAGAAGASAQAQLTPAKDDALALYAKACGAAGAAGAAASPHAEPNEGDDDAGGCTIAAPAASRSGLGVALLGLGLVLRARRRGSRSEA